MAALDTEKLLQPVSEEQPCGLNLEYEAEYEALKTAAQFKPEQVYGDTVIPAEDPDWREVSRLALGLSERTHDLLLACHLARALVHLEGLEGFCASLRLIKGYVEHFWPSVYPLLDVEDDNDPTARVNTVASLADRATTVTYLLNAPLVKSQVLGEFSMRDVQVAKGEATPHADDEPADMASIQGAFMDCDVDELRERVETVSSGYDDAVAIEDIITNQVGAANAVSLENLTDTLKLIRDFLRSQLEAREGQAFEGEADAFGDAQSGSPTGAGPAAAGGGQPLTGEIRSREDVIRALDKICSYYERSEPSSPVPMLLQRAKRLATKNFLDILADLSPDGVPQARLIGGMDDAGSAGSTGDPY